MLGDGNGSRRRSIKDAQSARFRRKSTRNADDTMEGGSGKGIFHDSSELEHNPRGPGTHSTRDMAATALNNSKQKLADHLENFVGNDR